MAEKFAEWIDKKLSIDESVLSEQVTYRVKKHFVLFNNFL